MSFYNHSLRDRLKISHRLLAYLLLFFLPLAVQGCAEILETAELTIKGHSLEVEIARTADQQTTGLMHRKSLPANKGMLFVYDDDRKRDFWMKNTSIPLSLAFIAADGTIKEIYDMKPFSLRLVSSRYSIRYALEVNQGFFRENGISAGDRVTLPEDL